MSRAGATRPQAKARCNVSGASRVCRALLRAFFPALLLLLSARCGTPPARQGLNLSVPAGHAVLFGTFQMKGVDVQLLLRIVNTQTQVRYDIPFARGGHRPLRAVSVPPGSYRLESFVLFGGKQYHKFRVPAAQAHLKRMEQPFTVRAGEAAYMGWFLAEGTTETMAYYDDVDAVILRRISLPLELERRRFFRYYPRMAGAVSARLAWGRLP